MFHLFAPVRLSQLNNLNHFCTGLVFVEKDFILNVTKIISIRFYIFYLGHK